MGSNFIPDRLSIRFGSMHLLNARIYLRPASIIHRRIHYLTLLLELPPRPLQPFSQPQIVYSPLHMNRGLSLPSLNDIHHDLLPLVKAIVLNPLHILFHLPLRFCSYIRLWLNTYEAIDLLDSNVPLE